MKFLFLFAWIIFVTGLAFQFLHFPFDGFLLFSGCLLLWIHGLAQFWKNKKTNLPGALLYLAVAALTTYMLCRLQYWAWAKLVYYVAILLAGIYLVLYLKLNIPLKRPQFLLLAYFVFILYLAYTPAYRIYYVVMLNETLNSDTKDLAYRSWDKYSWFLYLHDKQVEALDANRRARVAVKASLKGIHATDAASFATQIELHALQIKEKKWESYP